jgi:hypothetical protein
LALSTLSLSDQAVKNLLTDQKKKKKERKYPTQNMAGRVVQEVQHLLKKHEVLCSSPVCKKNKKIL